MKKVLVLMVAAILVLFSLSAWAGETVEMETKRVYIGEFASGSVDVNADMINNLRQHLSDLPSQAVVTINTRTDSKGSSDFDQEALANNRAKSIANEVRRFLPENQLPAENLIINSKIYSDEDPVDVRGVWVVITAPKNNEVEKEIGAVQNGVNSLRNDFNTFLEKSNLTQGRYFWLCLGLIVLVIVILILVIFLHFRKNKNVEIDGKMDCLIQEVAAINDGKELVKQELVTAVTNAMESTTARIEAVLNENNKPVDIVVNYNNANHKAQVYFKDGLWHSPFTQPSGAIIAGTNKGRVVSETKRKFVLAGNDQDKNHQYYKDQIDVLVASGVITVS